MLMKVSAYIFLLSLMILGSYPLIQHLQIPAEPSALSGGSCCCSDAQDSCADEGADQEENKGHDCDTGCDCGCQFHLNAIQFQFNNLQVAEENEYHYGEYCNVYTFEYFSLHIPPPRLG